LDGNYDPRCEDREGFSRFAGLSTGLWRFDGDGHDTRTGVAGADATTAGMVFLVLVVWSSTQAGRWLALFVAVICALSFDYFFLPPFHTLRLAGGEQWWPWFRCSELPGRRPGCRACRARRYKPNSGGRRGEALRAEQEMMLHETQRFDQRFAAVIDRIFALNGVRFMSATRISSTPRGRTCR